MKWLNAALPVAVGLLTASAAVAQNQQTFGQNPQQNQQQNQQPGQFGGQGQVARQDQPSANTTDMQIAAWLLVGNHEEVAMGKLAEQHADSKKVKDIAREMVQQHSQCIDQLHRFAGARANSVGLGQNGASVNGTQPNAAQQPGVQQPGVQQQTAQQAAQQPPAQPPVAGQPGNQTLTSSITNNPNTVGMGQGLDFMAVIQQMGQQCEQGLSRELGEKQGAEFDKGYVGQQIGAHLHMLTQLRVLKQFASPQMQEILAKGEQTTQHHLDQFKQLMKSLESSKSSS